ncbi:hypothetical protein ACIA8G_22685 [Lentzea sp. NPDC051213]|uniref:hypothetical protein n=1 Tax=Lentzea sp. NPDC051213 TaxID=3364126 RepID=UPI0037A1AA61
MAKQPDPHYGSRTQGHDSPAYNVGGGTFGDNAVVQQGNRNKNVRKNTRNTFNLKGVGGIVLAVAVIGGGGFAGYQVLKPSANVSDAIGTWEQKAAPGNTVDLASTLVIGSDRTFRLTMKPQFQFPDVGGGVQMPKMDISCGGAVEASGDHLALSSTSGPCGAMTAKVSGQRIDLTVSGDNGDQTLSLTRAG